jgi:branched-subunit amino acid transport protein
VTFFPATYFPIKLVTFYPVTFFLLTFLSPEVVKNLFTYKPICRFYACIQNQIIHKHVHVDYKPIKRYDRTYYVNCIPYAAGPEN